MDKQTASNRRWLHWYAANISLWALMILIAILMPDLEQETDVFLLSVVIMRFIPLMFAFSIILVIISCYIYAFSHRAAGSMLIFILSMVGLLIVLTLIGPAMRNAEVLSIGAETRVKYMRSSVDTEWINYACDRWLLSCDVVERSDSKPIPNIFDAFE